MKAASIYSSAPPIPNWRQLTEADRIEFVTEEQKDLALQAEQDIKDWLTRQYQGK